MSAAPLVRGSARSIGERILMAPGPGGTLFVTVPAPGGAVLALLDESGRPRPGWPIAIDATSACGQPLPVHDGSVRIVCDGPGTVQDGPSGIRAFGFDADGRLMTGWPVDLLSGPPTASVIETDLVVIEMQRLTDPVPTGVVSHEVLVTTIAADGAPHRGTPVPLPEVCCRESWAVGPDGVAYGVTSIGEWFDGESRERTRITALDGSGVRAGWPVEIDGAASGPAFGSDGRIFVTVGSFVRRTSRVLAFDRDGHDAAISSRELPIATGALFEYGVDGPYECGIPMPHQPVVAHDGTIFVLSEVDAAIVALEPTLGLKAGWPYEPRTPLVRRDPQSPGDLSCPSLSFPAAGPDGTLILPLQAQGSTVGGSLAAVGSDGQVRSGWPVELNRPGAESWSVDIAADGTVYALAIEPEAGDAWSATALAIAPDGTVLSTTTLIEP